MKLIRLIKKWLGWHRWIVFTADQSFVLEGRESPPRLEGETARIELSWRFPTWHV